MDRHAPKQALQQLRQLSSPCAALLMGSQTHPRKGTAKVSVHSSTFNTFSLPLMYTTTGPFESAGHHSDVMNSRGKSNHLHKKWFCLEERISAT